MPCSPPPYHLPTPNHAQQHQKKKGADDDGGGFGGGGGNGAAGRKAPIRESMDWMSAGGPIDFTGDRRRVRGSVSAFYWIDVGGWGWWIQVV